MKPPRLGLLALLAVSVVGAACGPHDANPRSLWLYFAQREVDLVLIDHEPPPF